MKDQAPCEVTWCTAISLRGRYCGIHANRPANARENRESWERRIRAEDKAAKKAREEAEAAEAEKAKAARKGAAA